MPGRSTASQLDGRGMALRLSGGVVLGLVALGLAACTGGPPPKPVVTAEGLPVPKALFDATWPLEVVEDSVRAKYEEPVYVDLTWHRDARRSLGSTNGEASLGAARAHADAAALYRQGALAAGTAYVQYFDTELGQPYDPAEKVHLIMVGKTLLADNDGAKAQVPAIAALGPDSPVAVWAAPWLAMHQAGSAWPPDLSGLPFQPPEVKVGEWPEYTGRPTYTVQEQDPGTNSLAVDDPAVLLQLALWHDAAALKAAGAEHADALAVYGSRYLLPAEPRVAATVDLPLEFRFGGDYLHPADGAFMASVTGSGGAGAVDAYADKSFLAAVAKAVRGDNGKISSEKAVDLANDLRKAWKSEQAKKAGGSQHASHPIFADVAVAGVYRNLAIIAEVEGDREASGKLRIAARDMGELDAAAAPEGLMSLVAWDAENQYTMRGLEIIHQQARRAPSLEVVRTALDLLAIRVGRSRGSGGTPGL